MAIDEDDEYLHQPDAVVNIPASEPVPEREDQSQNVLMADDFFLLCSAVDEAMKELVLPPLLEEPRILEDAVNTWSVENWRSMSKKEHGPIFQAGGFPWRILLFPNGNNVDHCSIYLEHAFQPQEIPPNWSCCVQFALVLWNPKDPSVYHEHNAHHRFTKDESDWGFTRFIEIRKLVNPSSEALRPFLEDDTTNITAYVRIVEDETGVLWHNLNNYDSKVETGFVGLKNQGATCYLNSLLQSLYVTNAFRKAIYEIPTENDEDILNSAYTLQRLFYQLQTSDQAVSTLELTKSFGWDTKQVFEQQDVQELSRKLMERMEEKMKGTKAEKVLPDMFSGKIKTYISCINVDYESSRIEDFWDIQLNVSGNKNLEESFKDYIQVEKLEGDNQYYAGEEHKLQDAKKGVIFTSFPDVLHLQLKRFEYDFERDALMKINDRHEFPEEFDAAPYLSKDAEKTDESWEYQLHGVLVHSGVLDAGHYYAFLKPNKDGWFYRFDDDKVVKSTLRDVLEENYGGAHPLPTNRRGPPIRKHPVMRMNSAYMLVYIRKSRLDRVLCPVTQADIPQHIQTRYQEEVELKEARRKEREEAHLYMTIKYATLETFKKHDGIDLSDFDLSKSENPGVPKVKRVLRTMSLSDLRDELSKEMGVSSHNIRLWQMVNRQNKTVRPDTPIVDLGQTVDEAWSRSASQREQSMRLFVEVAETTGDKDEPIWPNFNSQNGVLVKGSVIFLMLKCFDTASQTLRGVGHVYMEKNKRLEDLIPQIGKIMGWPESLQSPERILMWEEIKPTMIEPLKVKSTFHSAELVDGDIICFQLAPTAKPSSQEEPRKPSSESGNGNGYLDKFETANQYYDFLCNKRTLQFVPHPTRCDESQYPDFSLTISSKIPYEKLAERIGHHLGVAATHLRLWTINPTTGNPKVVIRRTGNTTLQSILIPNNYGHFNAPHRTDALYFEVLEISLAEMETKKSVRTVWLSEGVSKEEPVDVLVNKNGLVQDLIDALIKKLNLKSEEEAGPLRIYEVNNFKLYRELGRDILVTTMNEYTTAYVERIPEEEVGLADDKKRYINAFHFHGEPSRVHGDEPFVETKKRLEKRTGFKGKSFEKIKFAMVERIRFTSPVYLSDDDVLYSLASVAKDDCLGLDHPDRSRMQRGGGDLFLN
ncbi:putative ubiquitin carboxyl-terminal hydrolase 5 [Ceratocystis lukuohia]|uniref:ubiquitinyl hydrolase 1 n=1 Tax=Ceratocystis lukuohia TaxID=2019550 RepID=A0ABR4MML5_9PEZI